MQTTLIINASEVRPFAEGRLNSTLSDVAKTTLGDSHTILETTISEGYDSTHEATKFQQADTVIFQFPMFWFSFPSTLKKYIDDVYQYGVFFEGSDVYGQGGLMTGRKYMFSMTLNAPRSAFGEQNDSLFDRGLDDAIVNLHAIQKYVGMTGLPTFAIHDVFNSDIETSLMKYREHLSEHLLET